MNQQTYKCQTDKLNLIDGKRACGQIICVFAGVGSCTRQVLGNYLQNSVPGNITSYIKNENTIWH
jgi:hypothetical protein